MPFKIERANVPITLNIIKSVKFSIEGSEFSVEGCEFRNRSGRLKNRNGQLNDRNDQLNNSTTVNGPLINHNGPLINWKEPPRTHTVRPAHAPPAPYVCPPRTPAYVPARHPPPRLPGTGHQVRVATSRRRPAAAGAGAGVAHRSSSLGKLVAGRRRLQACSSRCCDRHPRVPIVRIGMHSLPCALGTPCA